MCVHTYASVQRQELKQYNLLDWMEDWGEDHAAVTLTHEAQ